MHSPLALLGQFKYATPRSLVVVPDRGNVSSDERFEYRDWFHDIDAESDKSGTYTRPPGPDEVAQLVTSY